MSVVVSWCSFGRVRPARQWFLGVIPRRRSIDRPDRRLEAVPQARAEVRRIRDVRRIATDQQPTAPARRSGHSGCKRAPRVRTTPHGRPIWLRRNEERVKNPSCGRPGSGTSGSAQVTRNGRGCRVRTGPRLCGTGSDQPWRGTRIGKQPAIWFDRTPMTSRVQMDRSTAILLTRPRPG